MKLRLSLLLLAGLLAGCGSMYYATMEKMGIHKRDIMVDRVKAARDSQEDAKQQFLTTMEQFRSVVHFEGGELQKSYDRLSATLQESEAKANEVSRRIRAVEHVSEALFKEWREEIKQYDSDALRRSSQRQYDTTRQRYTELMAAMKKAEARLEPALIPLRDQVLFLKHNLNAAAIAGLKNEVVMVESNVDVLVRSIEQAIAQADAFIASLDVP
ncbi:DUF2959 domain-containing protein [Geoalkalibacter halelectricus]|uniref:DUF2959 domain-containing protein n=1 Tax=Geoalkalibacter halelectricus TaxID=2847045 RepID=A0ABY5ZG46_9BACT|nr:DUF2959 domain-containing protein [Geoalkalibacter halelectricus]UWZ78102.1 DUF2959 domain-containing protein [Geoalkalibacter halelectricus]